MLAHFNFKKMYFLKKVHHAVGLPHLPIVSSKVVANNVFALESFSYINKFSKTEILAFCY